MWAACAVSLICAASALSPLPHGARRSTHVANHAQFEIEPSGQLSELHRSESLDTNFISLATAEAAAASSDIVATKSNLSGIVDVWPAMSFGRGLKLEGDETAAQQQPKSRRHELELYDSAAAFSTRGRNAASMTTETSLTLGSRLWVRFTDLLAQVPMPPVEEAQASRLSRQPFPPPGGNSSNTSDGHGDTVISWATRPSADAEIGHHDAFQEVVEWYDWAVVAVFLVFLAVMDYYFMQRMQEGLKAKVACILFWIGSGLSFTLYVWIRHGPSSAFYWLNGYYLEYMLSFDNLLAFNVIFKCFRTPEEQMHKALFVGVWSVVVCRLVFFALLGPALETWLWVHYVLGCLLIFQALMAIWDDDDDDEDEEGQREAVNNTYTVRFVKWLLGSWLWEDFDKEGKGLFVWKDGYPRATLLLVVVLVLELSDIVFALDSTSTKVVVMPSTYAAYTSTLLACLGLRSLYFVLHDMVSSFHLLKYGIAFSLGFIGVTLFIQQWVVLKRWLVCVIVASSLFVTIPASLVITETGVNEPEEPAVKFTPKTTKPTTS